MTQAIPDIDRKEMPEIAHATEMDASAAIYSAAHERPHLIHCAFACIPTRLGESTEGFEMEGDEHEFTHLQQATGQLGDSVYVASQSPASAMGIVKASRQRASCS